MALYEYYCKACDFKFEQITSNSHPEAGKCPKCSSKKTQKLISRFAIGGQGDLRESTFHGCHEHYTGLPGSGSDHSHHDHSDDHSHSHHDHAPHSEPGGESSSGSEDNH